MRLSHHFGLCLGLVILAALLGATGGYAQTPVPCPNGPADGKQIRVDGTVPVPLAIVYQIGDSILKAHGYQWVNATPVAARITAPRFGWPPGTEAAPWHGAESPGLIISLSAFAAHDSTRLSIVSEVVCRVSPPAAELADSSVESQIRVMGAVEIVSGMAEALRRYASRAVSDSVTP